MKAYVLTQYALVIFLCFGLWRMLQLGKEKKIKSRQRSYVN